MVPKFQNEENCSEILKAAKEKCQVTYKGKHIRITEISQPKLKRSRSDIFQVQKHSNCWPRLLYLTKLSFKINGEIKTLMVHIN